MEDPRAAIVASKFDVIDGNGEVKEANLGIPGLEGFPHTAYRDAHYHPPRPRGFRTYRCSNFSPASLRADGRFPH